MLKEIVIAIESYFRAHRFISQNRLWKWILIPGICYTLLFIVGIYFFWISSDNAVTWLSHSIGIDRWLHRQSSGILSFFFVMGEIMIRLILLSFYFSLFKYLFLIIGSPVFAYLSEKTDALLRGKDFPFSWPQVLKDMARGIRLAFRNMFWQTIYMISLIILSFIPVVGWIVPVFALFVECYYYGFSMLDYSCERNKLSAAESIEYIGKHKGLAIGNGIVFYLMHLIPFLGWALAPAYAVVAATISLHHQEKDLVS